jgi:hypothetical protein
MRAMVCNVFQARTIPVTEVGTTDFATTMAAGGMPTSGGLVETANIGPTFALRSGDTILVGITAA